MAGCRSFLIWGSAGHAKVLAEAVSSTGGSVIALFDNDPNAVSSIPGVPVFYGIFGFANWMDQSEIKCEDLAGLVAIGGRRGRERLQIQKLFRTNGIALPVLIHPYACVSSSAALGEGTQVLAQSVIAADSELGEACIINHKASVDHECLIGNGVHLGPGATLCGCVTIGDNVFIGAGAVVLPRVTIGKNSIVGAGAVVISDVKEGTTVAGVPAKALQT